jgi:HEAT repeat protein/TolB-like protein
MAAEAPVPKPALVILDFDVASKDREPRGAVLADLVTAGIADKCTVVDRKDLKKILAEQKLNLTGLVAPEQAVKVGKLVGARLLLAGRVTRVGDVTLVTIRVISVESSRFKGISVQMQAEPSLEEIARKAAGELNRSLPAIEKDLSAPQPEKEPEAVVPEAAPSVVAVLNFANLGEAKWNWLGKGLADLTIGDLAGQKLRVVSREQMQEMIQELKRKQQPFDPASVARVLKAGRCIHGTFRVEAGKVQLHASILELTSGKQVHTATAAGDEAKLFALQKKLAAELADVLMGNRPGTVDPAQLPRWTENLKASELLYRGVEAFDEGSYLTAWGLFRRALRQDPGYADALYWSSRMMYYVQEYHQARTGMVEFCRTYPRHPRVGDAVMELIHAAQLSAVNAEEVLSMLAFGAHLAPDAEVPNQFGAGYSSTVSLYSAGLASQILRAQGRFREAFLHFDRAARRLPVDHPLYWIAWNEMFFLKVEYLKATGEPLEMPPPAVFPIEWARKAGKVVQPYDAKKLRSPGGLHPDLEPVGLPVYTGMIFTGGDEPAGRRFTRLSPTAPSVEFDYRSDPLRHDRPPTDGRDSYSFTYYFHADPAHFLTSLDLEVRYTFDPGYTWKGRSVRIGNESVTLEPGGVSRATMHLPHGTRATGFKLSVSKGFSIQFWKVTAHFRKAEAGGTLIFKSAIKAGANLWLDGAFYRLEPGTTRVDHVPAGKHTLTFRPVNDNFIPLKQLDFPLADGDVAEVGVVAQYQSISAGPHRTGQINTPYEPFRMSAALGDRTADMCFFEDREHRWIVVWTNRRNLYLAISGDRGRTWSPTMMLPPPVNSAHDERSPLLAQDGDGRYLLAFASDRNLARSHATYICWSDDLVNFSAPALVTLMPSWPHRILRREDGTYLTYFRDATPTSQQQTAVCTSTDLIHWSKPHWFRSVQPKEVVQENGAIVQYSYESTFSGKDQKLQRWTSPDGIHFSDPETIPFRHTLLYSTTTLPHSLIHSSVACRQVGGRTLLALMNPSLKTGVVLRRDGRGEWKQIADVSQSYRIGTHAVARGVSHADETGINYFDTASEESWTRQFVSGDMPLELGARMYRTRYEYRWQSMPADPAGYTMAADLTADLLRTADVPLMERQVTDEQPSRRLDAAYLLAMTGRSGPAIVNALIEGLKLPNPARRRNAARGLDRLGTADAVPALIDALVDRDASVRERVIHALQGLPVEPGHLPAVTRVIRNRDAAIRRGGIQVLPSFGSDAVPHLIGALRDEDLQVRKSAAQSLAVLSLLASEVVPALEEAAANGNGTEFRTYARAALRHITPHRLSSLAETAGHPTNPYTRAAALRATVCSGQSAASVLPLLRTGLRDKESCVRLEAARALGEFGAEAALPDLLEIARSDADTNVQAAAVDALAAIGSPGIEALAEVLQSGNVEARRHAARRLFNLGRLAKPAAAALRQASKDTDAVVRTHATAALTNLGEKP